MKVRVLGCSGGIGGRHQRTTALLVDDDVLIDAGTGVGDLEFDELLRIDHVFVTHAHLDHIAMIPLLVDTVGEARSMPIVVHGSPETLRILRSHIFNWLVWPDFSSIPDRGNPFLRFQEMHTGETANLGGGRSMTALPALHTVPAVAYQVSGVLEIDLQGARQVRESMPEALFVFLDPPSWDELVRRLIGRGTESRDEREARLATARVELAAADEFDVRIVNDDVQRAAEELVSLMG